MRNSLSPAVGALVALAAGGVLAVGVVDAPAAQSAPARATSASSCTVADATLTWGVKESFRSYISGSIAKGSWETSGGATYATPSFGWTAGAGSLVAGVGDVAFTGSVRFTGHQGVLDTTVADPTLRLTSPTTAELLLDVTGTTQEGEPISAVDVPFGAVDLSATPVAGDVTGTASIVEAPVTLTDAGAAAFGTYPAGTTLDPVGLSLPVTCVEPAPASTAEPAAGVETTPAAASTGAAGEGAATASSTSGTAGVAGIAAAVTGVGAAGVITAALIVRRRRASSAAASIGASDGPDSTPSTDPEESR